ncbi:unnamed protein product [Effrenium voratum]|nr:unnamed protein product [Effrenium voratum]CAJ1452918.1 unnamed protein product [Effrenium voratum]
MRRFGCLLPSLLAAVLLYAGAANLSRCFVVSNAATGVGSRVSRAAVQLDVPMKEADLIQPSEEPSRSSYLFGFVPFAEQLNGRVPHSACSSIAGRIGGLGQRRTVPCVSFSLCLPVWRRVMRHETCCNWGIYCFR